MGYRNYSMLNKTGISSFWYMNWDSFYDYNFNFFKKKLIIKIFKKSLEEKLNRSFFFFNKKNFFFLKLNKKKIFKKNFFNFKNFFFKKNKFKKIVFIGKIWLIEFQNWILISFNFLKKKLKFKKKKKKKIKIKKYYNYLNLKNYLNFF